MATTVSNAVGFTAVTILCRKASAAGKAYFDCWSNDFVDVLNSLGHSLTHPTAIP